MIIIQVPLRVSFFGGGTDFPEFYKEEGGCALTMAINKYIYVIVKPRFDDNIRLTYTKAELVKNVKDLKHDIVRECLKYTGITKGIEVITIGDVPSGTGLGSSSAVTVGVLKALHAYNGIEMDAEGLALAACYIERDVLHKPIGIQDQYISAYGGFRLFEFKKDIVVGKKVSIDKIMEHLLLFYTGVSRDSGEILKLQTENTQKNLKVLREMKALAYRALSDKEDFGQLLDKSWKLKKKLARSISNAKIDALYRKAKKAGATGGKILGAGGGGFLLLYCPNDKKDAIRQTLSDLDEIPISPEPDGAKVILNYRT